MMFNRALAQQCIDDFMYISVQIEECSERLKVCLNNKETAFTSEVLSTAEQLEKKLEKMRNDLRRIVFMLESSIDVYIECERDVVKIIDKKLQETPEYMQDMISQYIRIKPIYLPIKISLDRG